MIPLKKGWWWFSGGWIFDPDKEDTRSEETRTKEEIAKSFNSVFDFSKFTAESAEDFEQQYLPMLDVHLKVLDDGKILSRHFYKPMINNMVLQNGTALSKGTVFSSLRQDLVRHLLNTSELEGIEQRLLIINECIQILVNSMHSSSLSSCKQLQNLSIWSQGGN